MKLTIFEVRTQIGPVRRMGIYRNNEIIDIQTARSIYQNKSERAKVDDNRDLTWDGTSGDFPFQDLPIQYIREICREAIDSSYDTFDGATLRYNPEQVNLLNPVPKPNSIRAFSVFEEHLSNVLSGPIAEYWYEKPVYWKGNPEAIVHPNDNLNIPEFTEELDFELEIAAVIGTKGKNIDVESAHEHIFGYTIHNDWSARDVQRKEMSVELGPSVSKDFANGFGPYLTTSDEITEIASKTFKIILNDKVIVERKIGEMKHSFKEMISYTSTEQTLYPGDIFVSGTVGEGCGLEHDIRLSAGDTIELYIQGLGRLSNTISAD